MVWNIEKIQNIMKDMEKTYPMYKNVPTENENEILCKRIQNNDKEAETELLIRNRKMALDILDKYYYGENTEDAYMAVLFSFLKAATGWDKEKGKFSTYAYMWGRNAIEREVKSKDNPVALPYYLQNKIYELNKIIAIKKSNHEIDTSTEELAKILNIPEYTLQNLLPFALNMSSLDKTLASNENGENNAEIDMYRYIEDEYDLEEEITKKVLADSLFKVAKKILTEDEYIVISTRVGKELGYPVSLKETSKYIEKKTGKRITTERVRQIEGKALRKLRHSKVIYKDIQEQHPELVCSQRKYLKW